MRAFGTALLRPLFGVTWENVPALSAGRPFILAANHSSFLDPVFLQLALKPHLTFMMSHRFHRSRLLNWLYRTWGTIPVRDGGEGSLTGAFKASLQALGSGCVLCIFPEGRISRDGRLGRGQPGVGAIMLRARVPVVPVAILGARDVLPRHATFPRPGRVRLVFGKPIEPPPESDADRKEAAHAFAALVMERIAALMDGAARRGS